MTEEVIKKVRRCYVMIEDIPGSTDVDVQYQYAADYGLGAGEELPESVNDLSPAQEAAFLVINGLRSVTDAKHKQAMRTEINSQIVVPEHIARK